MINLIINLLGGAVGGNIVGGLLKKLSLGTLWNSIIGILGGGLGGRLMDSGNIFGNILSSGVGGGVLLAIIGYVKNQMATKK